MITLAQYWISCGSTGGGFGISLSATFGRNVNRSTRENTFVIRRGASVGAGVGSGGARSFSFPRDVNALTTELVSRDVDTDTSDMGVKVEVDAVDDDAVDTRVRSPERTAVSAAGWKLGRCW